MAFKEERLKAAAAAQDAAAGDGSDQVRLIAGPGTGKSRTIEERVCFLVGSGVPADRITAVSFTRTAAYDLQERVRKACTAGGHDPDRITVNTLHSVALRALKARGALEAYPVDPQVLDKWELRLFDEEFGKVADIRRAGRRKEIREDREAFWSTGRHDVRPSDEPPEPPISDAERGLFDAFHRPRTQLYACVLPGEIVQKCVSMMEAGTLDPVELLGLDHLIVDEFQDLNPMDLRFVEWIARRGVTVFVAGDDDQSLYSFRYASPEGIQRFTTTFGGAGDHSLEHCFRCAPAVLAAAEKLIAASAAPGRIPKTHFSMYADAEPPVQGGIGAWHFFNDNAEAVAIAESCKKLIAAGMPAREIMVLLSNAQALAPEIMSAFEAVGVPLDHTRDKPFSETNTGRALFVILRLAGKADDYIALRSLLTLCKNMGVGTAAAIADKAILGNLNYRDLFFEPLPADVFGKREQTVLEHGRGIAQELGTWSEEDVLAERAEAIDALLHDVLGDDPEIPWRDELSDLPDGTTITEAAVFVRTAKADERAELVAAIRRRLGEEVTPEEALPDRVRMMTMHSAKGLSAQIVFIPGLEEELLPGEKRGRYAGLVLEAARMLYVSITRARLGCILSYSDMRYRHGGMQAANPSRFATDVGHTFERKTEGMTDEAVAAAIEAAGRL